MEYTQAELMEILNNHEKWLAGTGGICADLSSTDLSDADLRDVDLRGANLSGADLSGTDLRCADLRGANLSDADLSVANLRHVDLSGANLRGAYLSGADLGSVNLSDADLSGTYLGSANLSGANLSGANLSGANLRRANLSDTDLSGVKGLLNPIEYIEKNFEKTEEGIIVYKSFGEDYTPNSNWKIEEGSIIEEVVNPLPSFEWGCGINVGTKEWAERECNSQIWECLIRWEWLAGVVVPYQTEGQIRASKVQLIKPVNRL